MKKTMPITAMCLSLGLASFNAHASEITSPEATGEAMAQQCAPCHGTNGQALTEAMPPLAGMAIEDFEKAMFSYRDGSRDAVIMDRVARGFTDAEIHAMAVWFEKQPFEPWADTTMKEAYAASKAAKKAMEGQQ